MKKLISIIIGSGLAILSGYLGGVLIANASVAVGWNATSTDSGFIIPNSINGIIDAIKIPYLVATSTTATSTFANGVTISAGLIQAPCFSNNGTSCITGAGGSGTVTQVNTTWPILGGPITNTGTLTFGGLSTSTAAVLGNLLYFSGVNTVANVATSTLTPTSPLTGSFTYIGTGASLGIQAASASLNGYLAALDYSLLHTATTTFTSPLIYTQSTNEVTCQTVTGSVPGCLSASDWTTFNGKQAAGNYITALTGDVTASGPGSVASTLKNTGPGAGSFTNSNITIDAQGRVTAASNGSAGTGNVSTSTSETAGNLAYWTSTGATPATLGKVATSSLGITGPITFSGTLGSQIGGTSGNFGCATCLTSAVTSVAGTWPILSSGGNTPTISWGGLASSTGLTAGSLLYATGVNTYAVVSTTTGSCSGSASCPQFTIIGSTPIIITATGGSGSVYPFTPQTYGVSTSTTFGFLNGILSTASSTFNSTFNLPALSNGGLGVNSGLVYSGATTTAGTGLTYTGNAFNVNTSQNITTLSNLTVAGLTSNTASGVLYSTATSSGTVSSPLTGSFTCPGSGCSIGIQAASASQNGYLSSGDFSLLHAATTTFTSPLVYTQGTNAVTCPTCTTGGVTSVTGTWPIASSGGTTPVISWTGLASSTGLTQGNLLYATGVNTYGNVATGTLSATGPLTVTAGQSVIGSGATVACTTAASGVAGCLSNTSFDTFNNKQATISVAWPITLTGALVGFNGLSTSSAAVVGNIPYFSGVNTFANVATSTLTPSSPLTGSFAHIGTTGSLGCQTASGSQAGCLSSTDWNTFNNKPAYPFTPTTNYAVTAQATTGIPWFQNGFMASTTAYLVNASTTVLSATSLCLSTDCRTSWPTGGGASPDWKQENNIYAVNSLTPTSTIPIEIKSTATSTFNGGIESFTSIGSPFFVATSSTATSTFKGSVAVGPSTASTTFAVDYSGHLITGGTQPTCTTNCASTPNIWGDDNNFRLLTGSAVSSVTVTFASTWKNSRGQSISPTCEPTDESLVTTGIEASSTPTTVTLSLASALTTKFVTVQCMASDNYTF